MYMSLDSIDIELAPRDGRERVIQTGRVARMNATDWRSIHDRLSSLDSESLVNTAISAAAAVLPIWEASAPPAVRERPIEAVTAIRAWATTRVVPSNIKKLARDAIGNALNASSEPHLASDLQVKAATGEPDTDGSAAQPGIAADGAVPRR